MSVQIIEKKNFRNVPASLPVHIQVKIYALKNGMQLQYAADELLLIGLKIADRGNGNG